MIVNKQFMSHYATNNAPMTYRDPESETNCLEEDYSLHNRNIGNTSTRQGLHYSTTYLLTYLLICSAYS